MQSPNYLIVLSILSAVAASAVAAPAMAETGSRTQPQSQAQSQAQSQTQSQSASKPVVPATISQNDRQNDRLDQLQTESQLRQQMNQSQFGVSQPAPDSLRFEQQMQQQINLQEPSGTQQNLGVRPSSALDQLQFEQRVRRNLQPPASPPAPRPAEPQASRVSQTVEAAPPEANKPEANKPEAESSNSSASSAAADSTQTASAQTAPAAPELTPQQRRDARRWVKQAATRMAERMTVAPPADPAPAQAQPAEQPAEQTTPLAATPAPSPQSQRLNLPDSSPASRSSDSSEQVSQAEPTGTRTGIDTGANIYSTEGFLPDAAAPEYLNPDPNPLTFPTAPSEVELAGTQPITIRQAIELALRNNPTLRQAQFQLERSQADLRRNQAQNLPSLDAVGGFTQSGSETGTRIPATTTNSLGQEQAVPPELVGNVVRNYQDNTSLSVGLELNYTVFTSGRRPALIRAAEQQVRIQQLEIERQSEQLILDTVGDYYDLQQASAQVNIFQANLIQAEQSLRDAQALERAGVGTRFDSLQAEVDVANARQRLTQQLSTLEIAQRQLGQRLNVAQTVDITAADPIEVAGVWDLSLEETIVQAYKNRVELEQQLVQRDIADLNRKAALAQLGPQVGFQGGFNLSSNDFELNGGPNYSYSLGLNARVPLYDGGDARSQANREESNISIAEAEFENQRDTIRLDVERGYSRLNSSFVNIQTTALAVTQAAEALRLARLRFQAGVGTQTDVLRQQSVLAEAQVNNLTAILDYNRALAVLQRGTSNYPEGYLNDVP